MANFLHSELSLSPGDVVQVRLAGCASDVFLVDSSNFSAYRSGRQFRYVGGHARQSPVRLQPPYAGRWHVVVQPIGGRVEASISVIR